MGALRIRMGFGGMLYHSYTIVKIRNPQKSIGNYTVPYITFYELSGGMTSVQMDEFSTPGKVIL